MTNVFSQNTVSLKLQKHRINNEIPRVSTPLLFYNDFDKYQGLKYTKDSLWICRIVLNRDQYWFDQFKSKDSLENYYLGKIQESMIDTTKLSKNPLKTFISVLVKIKNAKKIVIVDSNNDFNFSNESVVIYSMNTSNEKNYYENYENVMSYTVFFEKFMDSKIIKINEDLKIKPFDLSFKYENNLDNLGAVFFMPITYFKGILEIENETYHVNISRTSKVGFTEKPSHFTFSIVPANQKIRIFDWIKINQKLKINNKILEIIEFSAENQKVVLTMRPSTASDFGWNIGDFVPEDVLIKYFPKNYKTKNFSFINFWGSWCSPCIKEIPELKEFQKKNIEFINITSISCEYNSVGLVKAKEIVAKNEINWSQHYTLLNEGENLSDKLNINEFPTLIVLNHEGKIIARETGLGSVEKIREKFNLN